MLAEQDTNYLFKNDLVRTCLQLFIRKALRTQPTENFGKQQGALFRLATLFLELLERLLPMEISDPCATSETAQNFVNQLSVHVNHLNRAVKEVTGNPTTICFVERVISEAKGLLPHTDWDVAATGHVLGFEYAFYFNNFFKKPAGYPPLVFWWVGIIHTKPPDTRFWLKNGPGALVVRV